jgi:hypothetical protein
VLEMGSSRNQVLDSLAGHGRSQVSSECEGRPWEWGIGVGERFNLVYVL